MLEKYSKFARKQIILFTLLESNYAWKACDA